jgi:hypothetical protein
VYKNLLERWLQAGYQIQHNGLHCELIHLCRSVEIVPYNIPLGGTTIFHGMSSVLQSFIAIVVSKSTS